MDGNFRSEEKKELLKLARKTIRLFLESGKVEYPSYHNPKYKKKNGRFCYPAYG